MRGDVTTAGVGARPHRPTWVVLRRGAVGALLLIVVAALVGMAFAGPRSELAPGITIAGVDVGGLNVDEARKLLESRSRELEGTAVTFTAGKQRFAVTPEQLSIDVDWAGAVARAQRVGGGFGPVRGYHRLHARLTGIDIAPDIQAYAAALEFKVSQFAQATDGPHVEASLRLRGLAIEAVPGQSGQKLDREGTERALVAALGSLVRAGPVQLPVEVDPVQVTTDDLAAAKLQAELAISSPVRLAYGETRFKLPRWRIAELLSLPRDAATKVAIAGPRADAYFEKLQATVDRDPVDARFEVRSGGIRIVPAQEGLTLDVPGTAKELLAAAISPNRRVAEIAVATAQPERTTADAKAMGIERRLSSYTTPYAGSADRISNLRLAVSLLDGALVAPGGTFSLNQEVGERTLERGFRSAPVIIADEFAEDVGGGVSQVGTTVFNAAWEAGVKIAERHPHSLYISRYQLGRDATVNYPDLDLKFVNDTPKWMLVAGAAGDYGITVSIYGGGPERRVLSGEATIRVTGPPRIKRIPDPELLTGKTQIESEGSPAQATSVTRTVYDAQGNVLRDETWNTSYRGEFRIVRVGTKPPPKPKPKPAKDGARADTVPAISPGGRPDGAPTTTQP